MTMMKSVCAACLLSLTLSIAGTDSTSAGILPSDGEAQYELEFWESIRESTHAEDYEAYLEAYPDGRFAPLARSRAARYKETGAEPAPSPAAAAVAVEEMDTAYQTVTDANVRKQPSAKSARVGTLKKGERVQVTGRVKDRDWYRIRTPQGTGYVYAQLLREVAKANATPASREEKKPEPVRQNVPDKPKTPSPAASAPATSHGGQRDCDVCPEMVVLQPGSFQMGDDHGDRSEKPAHRVRIASPYAIGKYEVTLGQWDACVSDGPCRVIADTSALNDNSPALDLSWKDAQTYVRWLSQRTGKKYRLPTEAEWEYAARAGTSSRYWWGEKMEPGKANCQGCGGEWNREAPANVDAYPANPLGLHGMNGGVWEWVADCWHSSYRGAPNDGRAWTEPNCRVNVIRGGSWRNDSLYAHSASRFKYDSNVRYVQNGFRVAKSLD